MDFNLLDRRKTSGQVAVKTLGENAAVAKTISLGSVLVFISKFVVLNMRGSYKWR